MDARQDLPSNGTGGPPAAGAPAAVDRGTRRLDWVDIAKAGAILLVVVYHVGSNGLSYLTPGSNRAEDVWATLNAVLMPVRMPLFFLVSGVLAVGAIQRPWGAVWRKRVADLAWPFALWTLLFAVPYALAYSETGVTGTALEAMSWSLIAAGAYWYLPALAVFFVVAWLLRRTPILLLIISVALWRGAPVIRGALGDEVDPDAVLTIYRWATFLVWFALGVAARPLIERIAHLPVYVSLVTAPLYAVAAVLVYQQGWSLVPALNVLGLVTALILSAQLARSPRLVRLGGYLAKRTLPIYLIHPILLAILVAFVGSRVPNITVLSLVIVPVLVIAFTWLSVRAYDVLSGRAPWLFGLPRRRTRVEPPTRPDTDEAAARTLQP